MSDNNLVLNIEIENEICTKSYVEPFLISRIIISFNGHFRTYNLQTEKFEELAYFENCNTYSCSPVRLSRKTGLEIEWDGSPDWTGWRTEGKAGLQVSNSLLVVDEIRIHS